MNLEFEIEKICNTISGYHDFERAVESISKLRLESNDDQLFKIFWTRAIKSQTKNGHVYISALVLYKLNIDCPLTPENAIKQMCVDFNWDISIEEVPWYLANQFSKEVILELTEKLNFEIEEQNIKLQTINYWVQKMDTSI
jgi:hypothetical protein